MICAAGGTGSQQVERDHKRLCKLSSDMLQRVTVVPVLANPTCLTLWLIFSRAWSEGFSHRNAGEWFLSDNPIGHLMTEL